MARHSVTCYYAKGGKGKYVAPAFAMGCHGQSQLSGPFREGESAIYGVKEQTVGVWQKIQAGKDRWWYIDNAYFGRGAYYRITERRIQHLGIGEPDWDRWRDVRIDFKDWRTRSGHILVCEQSDNFMWRTCGISPDGWRKAVRQVLEAHTDRPIIFRPKMHPDDIKDMLRHCHAVVTFSSNSAIDALAAGVPVFVSDKSAAAPMGLTDLSRIEDPYFPKDREKWAAVLAGNQWTLEEMRNGTAWRALNGSRG